MGGEPRGRLRVGLEPEQTLFALQAAKIRALNPSQPPLCLVMTSAAVHEDTVSAFEDAGYFGLPRQRVEFLQQDSLPVIPLDSLRAPHKLDPVVTDAGTYRLSPTGHGGMLAALGRHPKLIDRLAEEKVQHLYSFIYPNVLERISDPVVIGFHAAKKTDVTVKAIPAAECRPGERMGRVVRAARGIRILEYSQIDPVRDSDAVTWPASIGAQVWSVEFLRKCLRGGIELPYHVLLRPHDNPREVKLETFNFDLLPYARSVGVVLVGRDQEYSPIKEQKDLESARERVRTRYREWCESGTL
jgi:UDP-N-acetylglucosamine/UDP-N-acetylgalactosamine diphosphorylase